MTNKMVTNNQGQAINCKQYLIFLLNHSRSRARVRDEQRSREARGWKPKQRTKQDQSQLTFVQTSSISFVVFKFRLKNHRIHYEIRFLSQPIRICLHHAHCEVANQSPFSRSWKTGTRLATSLRRRPFSLREKEIVNVCTQANLKASDPMSSGFNN